MVSVHRKRVRNVKHKVAGRLGAKNETPEMEMDVLLPSDI